MFRTCYEYFDPAVHFDNGDVGPALVRFFRACGDYEWLADPPATNHFLSPNPSRPGARVHPTGFVAVDGAEPPGLPRCGPCNGGTPYVDACSNCMPQSVLISWGESGPGGSGGRSFPGVFRCGLPQQYSGPGPVVDFLGFKLLGVRVNAGAASATFFFRTPSGVNYQFDTTDSIAACPDQQLTGSVVNAFPSDGAWDLGFSITWSGVP